MEYGPHNPHPDTSLQRMEVREQNRLKGIYPLLEFEFFPTNEYGYERVCFSEKGDKGSSYNLAVDKFGRVSDERQITEKHCLVSIKRALNGLYPFLFCSPLLLKDGISVGVWTKDYRGKDDTAVGHWDISDPQLHPNLIAANAEAEKASQEGWFYCSGHKRAEQRDSNTWFYFAGRYCGAWGEQNPRLREQARTERYN